MEQTILYKNKKIAVVGFARTGIAVAQVLAAYGAHVVISDKKSAEDLADAIDSVKSLNVELSLGTDLVNLDGIDLVVVSPGVPAHLPFFAEAKERSIEVISEIELAYRISIAPIIAITGTNGKTTTTVLTARIMMEDDRNTFIAGNVAGAGEKLGGDDVLPEDKQPVPLITAAHKASKDSVIVAEVSTFQLEQIKSFKPKVAALLNVTSDHLDRHASIEEYAGLKARIFENQTSDDFSIINTENPFTASLKDKLAGQVLEFSVKCEVKNGAFVRGNDIIVRIDGSEIIVCSKSDIILRGKHNLENVLAAACISIAFGVNPASIQKAVRKFKGVNHRLEFVAIIDGVEYINNSMCTNVDAAVSSVEAFDEPQIVICGGKDKGSDYTEFGMILAKKAKHVVLIGADKDLIRNAIEKAGFSKITNAETLLDAVFTAKTLAEPGDVVVLTPGCASFDMFSSFEDRGNQFKEIVLGGL